MTLSSEFKVDILHKSFNVLKDDVQNNSKKLAEIIGKMASVDVETATDMWECFIEIGFDKNLNRFVDVNGDDYGGPFTGIVMSEILHNGLESKQAIEIVRNSTIISKAIFHYSDEIPHFPYNLIGYWIINEEFEVSDRMINLVYENKNLTESFDEFFEEIILWINRNTGDIRRIKCVSDKSVGFIFSWLERISNEASKSRIESNMVGSNWRIVLEKNEKKALLISEFDELNKDVAQNAEKIAGIIGGVAYFDVDLAREMWEFFIKTGFDDSRGDFIPTSGFHLYPFTLRVSSKILNGKFDPEYYGYKVIKQPFQDDIRKEIAYKVVKNSPIILKSLFENTGLICGDQCEMITKAIFNEDFEIADLMLGHVAENKKNAVGLNSALELVLDEIKRECRRKKKLSVSGSKFIVSWCEKIIEEMAAARVIVKLCFLSEEENLELLNTSFRILISDVETNARVISELIGYVSRFDAEITISMWEKFIECGFCDETGEFIESKDLYETSHFTDSVIHEISRVNRARLQHVSYSEYILHIVLSSSIIYEALFNKARIVSIDSLELIQILISEGDFETSNKLMLLLYNNNNSELSFEELLEKFIMRFSRHTYLRSISNDAVNYLLSWCEEIECVKRKEGTVKELMKYYRG